MYEEYCNDRNYNFPFPTDSCSLSPSQERLLQENIAPQNEVKKLKGQLEYERLSNAKASNTMKGLEKLFNDDQSFYKLNYLRRSCTTKEQ